MTFTTGGPAGRPSSTPTRTTPRANFTRAVRRSNTLSSVTITKPMHSLTPHLICDGASDAIAFYVRAFGAVEEMQQAMAANHDVSIFWRVGRGLREIPVG